MVEEALSIFIVLKAQERRKWTYKKRLKNLRAKTTVVCL